MYTKKCPKCGKEIPAIAKKCEFCGEWQDEKGVKKAMLNRDTISSVVDLSKYNLSGTSHTYRKPNLSSKPVTKEESLKDTTPKVDTENVSVDNNIGSSENVLDSQNNLPHADVDVIKQKAVEKVEVVKKEALGFFLAQKKILIGIAAIIMLIIVGVIGYSLVSSDDQASEQFENDEEIVDYSSDESEDVVQYKSEYSSTSGFSSADSSDLDGEILDLFGEYLGTSNFSDDIESIDQVLFSMTSHELTAEEVLAMPKGLRRIVRNSIFARHGYIFKSEDLKAFFSVFPWYNPVSSNVQSKLSAVEKKNIELIKSYE